MLAAKSSGVVKAKQLRENITVDVGCGEPLMVAAAGSYVTWDDERGFRGFVEAVDFQEKWVIIGG